MLLYYFLFLQLFHNSTTLNEMRRFSGQEATVRASKELDAFKTSTPHAVELSAAVEGGDVDKLKTLLTAGDASIDLVHLAIRSNNPQSLTAILPCQTDVNQANSDGISAVHLTAAYGYAKIFEVLLQQDHVNANAAATEQFTPLHLAAQNGNKEAVIALQHNGADVNARTASTQSTPLHLAAKYGQTKVIKTLLRNGADVDAKDLEGWTPLQHAARCGNVAVVTAFVDVQADLVGRAATTKSASSCDDDVKDTPLQIAASAGHAGAVNAFLHRPEMKNAVQGRRVDDPVSTRVAAKVLKHLLTNDADANVARPSFGAESLTKSDARKTEVVATLLPAL